MATIPPPIPPIAEDSFLVDQHSASLSEGIHAGMMQPWPVEHQLCSNIWAYNEFDPWNMPLPKGADEPMEQALGDLSAAAAEFCPWEPGMDFVPAEIQEWPVYPCMEEVLVDQPQAMLPVDPSQAQPLLELQHGQPRPVLSHARVPKSTKLSRKEQPKGDITTLMIRNIPNKYDRKMLMRELDALGFADSYDFVYLPMDKATYWNVGYAFVNFLKPEAAARCTKVMDGYRFRKFRGTSKKIAQVSPAYIQGLEANLQHYENTAVSAALHTSQRPWVRTWDNEDGADVDSTPEAMPPPEKMVPEFMESTVLNVPEPPPLLNLGASPATVQVFEAARAGNTGPELRGTEEADACDPPVDAGSNYLMVEGMKQLAVPVEEQVKPKTWLHGSSFILSGTGMLGCSVARFLSECGVGHLLLLAHGNKVGAPSIFKELWAKLEHSLCLIELLACDVSSREDLVRIKQDSTFHAQCADIVLHSTASKKMDSVLRIQEAFRKSCFLLLGAAGCQGPMDAWASFSRLKGESIWSLSQPRPKLKDIIEYAGAKAYTPLRLMVDRVRVCPEAPQYSAVDRLSVLRRLLTDAPIPVPLTCLMWKQQLVWQQHNSLAKTGFVHVMRRQDLCLLAATPLDQLSYSQATPPEAADEATWAYWGWMPGDSVPLAPAFYADQQDMVLASPWHSMTDPSGFNLDAAPFVPGMDWSQTEAQFRALPEQPGHHLTHRYLPKPTNLAEKYSGQNLETKAVTTLMIRNVPNGYTRAMLMREMDSLGLSGMYDFVYLPIDRATRWNVGYAFINFVQPDAAEKARVSLSGHQFRKFRQSSGKVAEVSDALIQGVHANMKHYSNTAVQCARLRSRQPLVLNHSAKGEGEDAALELESHNADQFSMEEHGECHMPKPTGAMSDFIEPPVPSSDWSTFQFAAPWIEVMGTEPAPPSTASHLAAPPPPPSEPTAVNVVSRLPPGLDVDIQGRSEYGRDDLLSFGMRMKLMEGTLPSSDKERLRTAPIASISQRALESEALSWMTSVEADGVPESTSSLGGDARESLRHPSDPLVPVESKCDRPLPTPIGPPSKASGWALQSAPRNPFQGPESEWPSLSSEWPTLGSSKKTVGNKARGLQAK